MAETILETIAAHARRRVEEDRRRLPLELLRDQCGQEGQAGGRRFLNALQGRGLGLICEVKKASPSKGILSEDFPYLDVARDYQAAGADCISCLTEPKWFLGSDQVFGDIRAELASGIVPVGVFVDQPAEVPAALLRDGTISVAQLHGHEDDAYLAALRELAPGCVIWKTFQVRSAADLRAVHASAADLVLLDNGCGTGETFDWSLAGGVTRPFLLAGGLTPENIPAAVAALHPYGLDLSSGVETEKKKDRHKIEAAVAAARKE